jgi:hypothetical protein
MEFEAHEIVERMWLGSEDAALSEINELIKRNIKSILVCGCGLPKIHGDNVCVCFALSTICSYNIFNFRNFEPILFQISDTLSPNPCNRFTYFQFIKIFRGNIQFY